ncbi:C-terminal processing peptidase [Bertholletia excelsa]
MEAVVGASVYSPLSFPFLVFNGRRNPSFSPKVQLQKSLPVGIIETRFWSCLSCNASVRSINCKLALSSLEDYKNRFLCQPVQELIKKIILPSVFTKLIKKNGKLPKLKKHAISTQKAKKSPVNLKNQVSILFVHLIVGLVLVMTISVTVTKTSSWALTEENRLFLEAWRTIDRAYVDKTFNGQSWFRYRENALRNEPMNTREETYMAIRKMISTLDDPFTRFLEPEKFKSLRSGTQGALTGVGLSIGYPTRASPGGPANKVGILSGDVILKIDDTSTETMGIYDAAERLQGPEGTVVELTIRSGSQIKQLSLIREKVSLNPVQSRLCEIPGLGNDDSRVVGYIKLTSFNQNSSGAVKEAIETLRRNHVNAFVLDLRDNRLEKGVIVYICDNQGVRDIYDTDGSNAIAVKEPLAVLVNKGTASASEILAGALKDNKRAVLFGEPTYGKGKIQSVFELSDGSGLAVTVARYETPAHTDIDKVGVTPDHPLPASLSKDDRGFCSCLQDPASPCHLDRVELFSRRQ